MDDLLLQTLQRLILTNILFIYYDVDSFSS